MTVQHVALEVRAGDVPAEVGFWALLGFREVPAPESLAARTTWVQHGVTQVHLLHTDTPTIVPEGHVAVVCEDYEAALVRLRASGHAPEPRSEHWGSPRCFVRTPASHRVEVMAAAP